MTHEQSSRLRTILIDEARKLFRISVYIWVLLSLFSLHKAFILHDRFLSYHLGFALINALALAKVILIGQDLHLADRLKNRPLIYPIMFKSAVFAVLLVCFHLIEEMITEVVHGKTLSRSTIEGGTLREILMVGIMMFVVLIPFFGFMELERAIGPKELKGLLFGRKT
jgi:hypothetical protein